MLTCYVCSTKIGEISDISRCFENFVPQAFGVLTRNCVAELRKYEKNNNWALMATAVMGIQAQKNMENKMERKEIKQTAGRTALGEFAPEFAHLNDDILFGEVWNRQEEMSLHDRSLTTILSLVAQGITDLSLKYHLNTAKANGVTRQEFSEMITHAAFYVGWPKAWAVFNMAK